MNVSKPLGNEPKPRRAKRIEPVHFVARDGPIDSAQQHVELAIAIDVGELRDVLAIGVDGGALYVFQRVCGDDECRRRAGANIPIVADVAERRLGKQVVAPIAVQVDEAIPLADVDVLEAISGQRPASSALLKQLELSRILLHKEIEAAVAVDVQQLGARMIEPPRNGRAYARPTESVTGNG